MRNVTQQEADRMTELYKRGLSMRAVGERTSRGVSTVYRHLKNNGVKTRPPGFHMVTKKARERSRKIMKKVLKERWEIQINPELTPEKAYILAVVGPGDGTITNKTENRLCVMLGATDKDFVDEFSRCIEETYGVKPNRHTQNPNRENRKLMFYAECGRQQIVHDLLDYHNGDIQKFKEKTERIPKKVMDSNEEIKTSYLRAFFDSQGWVDVDKRIGAAKSNGILIKEIQTLLSEMRIESTTSDYTNNSTTGTWHIRVKSAYKKLFANKVGFSIERKRKRLEGV